MATPTLSVNFYVTDSGTEPVRDWLKSLPAADRKIFGADIKSVQYGWPMGMPLVRKMESPQTPLADLRIAKQRKK